MKKTVIKRRKRVPAVSQQNNSGRDASIASNNSDNVSPAGNPPHTPQTATLDTHLPPHMRAGEPHSAVLTGSASSSGQTRRSPASAPATDALSQADRHKAFWQKLGSKDEMDRWARDELARVQAREREIMYGRLHRSDRERETRGGGLWSRFGLREDFERSAKTEPPKDDNKARDTRDAKDREGVSRDLLTVSRV